MQTNWENLILAYLHNPPGKALRPGDIQSLSVEYASAALGHSVNSERISSETAINDILTSVSNSLSLPEVSRGTRKITVAHPLSGEKQVIELPEAEIFHQSILDSIAEIASVTSDTRKRFFLLWRFLRDTLAEKHTSAALVPADLRIPDTTIWQQMDIYTGLHAALEDGTGGAFLSFQISPVQGFIATRTQPARFLVR